jgi:hypothetical protein
MHLARFERHHGKGLNGVAFLFLEKGKCRLVFAFSASLVFPFPLRLFPCFMRGLYGSAKSEIEFNLLAINC